MLPSVQLAPSVRDTTETVSEVLIASAVAFTTSATSYDVTSISLPPGEWEVNGNLAFNPAAGTVTTIIIAWISTTSATFPTVPNKAGFTSQVLGGSGFTGAAGTLSVGPRRISNAGPGNVTVYLTGFAVFTISTMSGYGYLRAYRA